MTPLAVLFTPVAVVCTPVTVVLTTMSRILDLIDLFRTIDTGAETTARGVKTTATGVKTTATGVKTTAFWSQNYCHSESKLLSFGVNFVAGNAAGSCIKLFSKNQNNRPTIYIKRYLFTKFD